MIVRGNILDQASKEPFIDNTGQLYEHHPEGGAVVRTRLDTRSGNCQDPARCIGTWIISKPLVWNPYSTTTPAPEYTVRWESSREPAVNPEGFCLTHYPLDFIVGSAVAAKVVRNKLIINFG